MTLIDQNSTTTPIPLLFTDTATGKVGQTGLTGAAIGTPVTLSAGVAGSITILVAIPGGTGFVNATGTVTAKGRGRYLYQPTTTETATVGILLVGADATGSNTVDTEAQIRVPSGASSDPLANPVPGSYAAGTAGAALGTLGAIKTSADTAASNAATASTNASTAASAAGAAATAAGNALTAANSAASAAAALPSANAVRDAVFAKTIDGSVNMLNLMIALVAETLPPSGTNSYVSNTGVLTTIKKRQDGTTTAFTVATTLASGTAAPAPQSMAVTKGTLV